MSTQNILLQSDFNTPFNTIPFQQITLAHFKEAFPILIANARTEFLAYCADQSVNTFATVFDVESPEQDKLDLCASIFFNLNSSESSKEMQVYSREVIADLTSFGLEKSLNLDNFKRVEAVYNATDPQTLTSEEARLLHDVYKGYLKGGINLPEKEKAILKEYSEALAKLSQEFGENVLNATNDFQFIVADAHDLEGLPADDIASAKLAAEAIGQANAWLFTGQFTSYFALVKYAKNRAIRKQITEAIGSKNSVGKYSNQDIIKKIVNLRIQKANLLSYPSIAAMILENRMAKSPENVKTFLHDFESPARAKGQVDFEELKAFAFALDGISDFQSYDTAYYSEKLKQEKFSINTELLRPYFSLEKVVAGVFECAKRLFQLEFVPNKTIEVYHPDVTAYEVKKTDGTYVGIFYADFHPREGKKAGAWMTSFRNQYIHKGLDHRPHVSIVCSFTKPTPEKPSLLAFSEVTTLFHEFGHALHGLLANGKYASMSGTSVLWDFVELPSQMLENWCYEKECLDIFAAHYETGEAIPTEYIDRIKKSATFLSGIATLRQVFLGSLDMAWHSMEAPFEGDVMAFENAINEKFAFTERLPNECMSTNFSHIFQGGYTAAYYSYKWAEVLEADAFELFQEKGIFNASVAQSFEQHILSKGNSESPEVLFERFRGRATNNKALLKKLGFGE
jgi:peptidyl-dipeptidase Dcp